jgi:hypothetical protein
MHTFIRSFLAVLIISLNGYCIYNGIENENYTCVGLSVGSLLALVGCFFLIKKLRQVKEE